MKLRNFGDIYQFEVRDEADLARIDDLDPARWAATSAPVRDLHCDERFLRYLDADGTDRVRVAQLIAAREWTFARLARRDVLRTKPEVLPLDALAADATGEKLRATALRVNREQGAADLTKIALADVRGFKSGYQKLLSNGDGVVPPDVVPDADVAAFLKDVIEVVGSTPDRGGGNGVDAERLEKFTKQGRAWLAWRAEEPAAAVWGADTEPAWKLTQALDPKVEGFFLQSEVVRQELSPDGHVKPAEEDLRAVRFMDLAALERRLSEAPLAAPDPRGVLDLAGPVNAVFRQQFDELREKVLSRALPTDVRTIDRPAWRKVKSTFEKYVEWRKAMPPEPFEKLGEAKLKAYLEGPLPERAAALIAGDKAAQAEIDLVDDLEKLLLCARWLLELANNFVNFSAIYRPDATALVESGSLVIDGRRLDFCLKVADRAVHKPIASESLCFLVYAKITRREGGPAAFEVVAPVTGGEKGRLRVGKRGIFYDNKAVEWDAQITDIVENPISVWEAAVSPFRRAAKFVTDKVEEWVGAQATAHQDALQRTTAEGVESARSTADATVARTSLAPTAPGATPPATASTPPAAPGAPPPREGLNVNTLILGGGVALAGLGAVIASLFTALTSLRGWAAVGGVVALVFLTSALVGWLRLRRRDMSLLLEASGWAVNIQMKITRRVAPLFAYVPDLPRDAKVDRTDILPAVKGEGRTRRALALALLTVALAAAAWLAWKRYGR